MTEAVENGLNKRVITLKNSKYIEKDNRLNIIYDLPFSKSNNLEISVDYIYKTTKDTQYIDDNDLKSSNTFDIQYGGRYNVVTSRIGYSNKSWSFADFDFGSNFLFVENNANTFSDNDNSLQKYDSRSRFREANFANYVTLEKQIKKISIRLGLRNELKNIRYFNLKNDSVLNKRTIGFSLICHLNIIYPIT